MAEATDIGSALEMDTEEIQKYKLSAYTRHDTVNPELASFIQKYAYVNVNNADPPGFATWRPDEQREYNEKVRNRTVDCSMVLAETVIHYINNNNLLIAIFMMENGAEVTQDTLLCLVENNKVDYAYFYSDFMLYNINKLLAYNINAPLTQYRRHLMFDVRTIAAIVKRYDVQTIWYCCIRKQTLGIYGLAAPRTIWDASVTAMAALNENLDVLRFLKGKSDKYPLPATVSPCAWDVRVLANLLSGNITDSKKDLIRWCLTRDDDMNDPIEIISVDVIKAVGTLEKVDHSFATELMNRFIADFDLYFTNIKDKFDECLFIGIDIRSVWLMQYINLIISNPDHWTAPGVGSFEGKYCYSGTVIVKLTLYVLKQYNNAFGNFDELPTWAPWNYVYEHLFLPNRSTETHYNDIVDFALCNGLYFLIYDLSDYFVPTDDLIELATKFNALPVKEHWTQDRMSSRETPPRKKSRLVDRVPATAQSSTPVFNANRAILPAAAQNNRPTSDANRLLPSAKRTRIMLGPAPQRNYINPDAVLAIPHRVITKHIPTELIDMILSFCDPNDFAFVRLTCRRMHYMCSDYNRRRINPPQPDSLVRLSGAPFSIAYILPYPNLVTYVINHQEINSGLFHLFEHIIPTYVRANQTRHNNVIRLFITKVTQIPITSKYYRPISFWYNGIFLHAIASGNLDLVSEMLKPDTRNIFDAYDEETLKVCLDTAAENLQRPTYDLLLSHRLPKDTKTRLFNEARFGELERFKYAMEQIEFQRFKSDYYFMRTLFRQATLAPHSGILSFLVEVKQIYFTSNDRTVVTDIHDMNLVEGLLHDSIRAKNNMNYRYILNVLYGLMNEHNRDAITDYFKIVFAEAIKNNNKSAVEFVDFYPIYFTINSKMLDNEIFKCIIFHRNTESMQYFLEYVLDSPRLIPTFAVYKSVYYWIISNNKMELLKLMVNRNIEIGEWPYSTLPLIVAVESEHVDMMFYIVQQPILMKRLLLHYPTYMSVILSRACEKCKFNIFDWCQSVWDCSDVEALKTSIFSGFPDLFRQAVTTANGRFFSIDMFKRVIDFVKYLIRKMLQLLVDYKNVDSFKHFMQRYCLVKNVDDENCNYKFIHDNPVKHITLPDISIFQNSPHFITMRPLLLDVGYVLSS